MIISYLPLDIDSPHFEEVISIYKDAYKSVQTDTDGEDIRERFLKHSTYPGYSGWVAVCDEKVVGFAYGYTCSPGQFYRTKLEAVMEEGEIKSWLTDCFEFVELAVAPEFRRQGIASTLEKRLLDTAPNETSVLTTGSSNDHAKALYERLGWSGVKEAEVLPAAGPMLIMGKKLDVRAE